MSASAEDIRELARQAQKVLADDPSTATSVTLLVLRVEQNAILERIAAALERLADRHGGAV